MGLEKEKVEVEQEEERFERSNNLSAVVPAGREARRRRTEALTPPLHASSMASQYALADFSGLSARALLRRKNALPR